MLRSFATCLCVVTAVFAQASQPASQSETSTAADQAAAADTESPAAVPILGSLIGLWDVTMVSRNLDGSWPDETLHRLWRWYPILDGQAIQDDWIRVDPSDEGGSPPGFQVTGTNIRIYNPESDEWTMAWIDIRSRRVSNFTATNRDGTVVMFGHNAQGRMIRITFSNITARSFEWTQDWTSDEGETWFPVARMQCRRLK